MFEFNDAWSLFTFITWKRAASILGFTVLQKKENHIFLEQHEGE